MEVDTPLEFVVDTSSAGVAPLGVAVTDEDQDPVDVAVRDNQDGTYLCRYVPKKLVKHVVVVTFGGVVIPNFPVRVSISSLFKGKGKGKGLGTCYSAAYVDSNSSALQSRKWQLIDMS